LPPLPCMLMCALFLPIAHETAGAARIRHSLRPLFWEGVRIPAKLGRIASRERETISTVIASEAKQSISLRCARNDGGDGIAIHWLAMTRRDRASRIHMHEITQQRIDLVVPAFARE